jgi:branched-subunit amino acid transport protein
MSLIVHAGSAHTVPVAVLASLAMPTALAPKGHLEIGLPAWALLAGAVVAWRTQRVLWTIAGGLGTFWLLRALGL